MTQPGSRLRVQIQTDARHATFVERAAVREVLGLRLPVAGLEDALQGKVWAALAPERHPSKRRKDRLDIERLLEAEPEPRDRSPADWGAVVRETGGQARSPQRGIAAAKPVGRLP